MTNERDFADSQVTGISRYIPTTLSKSLLGLLTPAAVGAFVIVRQNPEWFAMQSLQPMHQTAVAIAVALGVALALTFVIILDLAVLFASKKHTRIFHHTNKKA